MEGLTKHQIVLLTLLVSFISSIATGIVTVALMDQAPATVTQTVNRVIERTIERVVEPAKPTAAEIAAATAAAAAINTNKPSGAGQTNPPISTGSADDLTAAIEKVSPSIVRIKGTLTADPPTFMSIGIVMKREGIIVADRNTVPEGGVYFAQFYDGAEYPLEILARNGATDTTFFRVLKENKDPYLFMPAPFVPSTSLRLGQAVAALGGAMRNTLYRGTITSLATRTVPNPSTAGSQASSTTPATLTVVDLIETDANAYHAMAPLFTNSGRVVGFRLAGGASGTYVPSEPIRALADQIAEAFVKPTATSTSTPSSSNVATSTSASAHADDHTSSYFSTTFPGISLTTR